MKQKRRYDNYDYNEAYQYDLDKEIEEGSKGEVQTRESHVDGFRRNSGRSSRRNLKNGNTNDC